MRTEYYDFKTKKAEQTQPSFYSYDPSRPLPSTKGPIFSYFYHDMDSEDKDHVMPTKQEQLVCVYHSEPVVYYSLPLSEFICHRCYDTFSDTSGCYALSDLQKPMEI